MLGMICSLEVVECIYNLEFSLGWYLLICSFKPF